MQMRLQVRCLEYLETNKERHFLSTIYKYSIKKYVSLH